MKQIQPEALPARAPYMEQHPEKTYTDYLCVNWQMMRGGSQFVPMIIMAVMLLFAVIVIIIAVIIISFSIKNFIQRNMKNTGILEAAGYTVKELRAALSFQIVSLSFLGALTGTAAGIATFGMFADVLTLAVGLTWNQGANIAAAVMTVLVPTAVVYLVSRAASLTYKRISVLDALRGGIGAHNFRKNCFTFERTPLPVSLVISLKETFGAFGRNLAMALIVAVITISVLIGFGMYENFGADPANIIRLFGFENATAMIAASEDIGDELRSLDSVENVLELNGMDLSVKKDGKEKMIYTIAMDDIENTTNLTVLEGRIPRHDNEILMTCAAAEDLSAGVGDVVTIDYAGESAEYLITGTYQRMDRMGRSIYMTFDAAEKIMPKSPVTEYWVMAEEGVSFDELSRDIEKIEKRFEGTFNVTDAEKQMEGTLSIVSSSMRILCIVIAIVTVIVVVFVESLLIRAKIVKQWRSMGISKALGMTSAQLIGQIQMSNMPAILAGVILGTALSGFVGSQMCMIIFSLFGIRHVDFGISPAWMIASAAGIIAVALLTSGVSGLRVRGLRPGEMITED